MQRAEEAPKAAVPPEARKSFEAFFEQHYRRLFHAMYLLTSDAAEAEDLAQEALVRVLERWDRLREWESADGYLYRTALNLHRSRLRRLLRPRRAMRGRDVEPDPGPGAEARVDILRALAGLSPAQREAVLLVDWLGMSAEQAGRLLRIEAGAVRTRLHRGRERLKERLGDHDG